MIDNNRKYRKLETTLPLWGAVLSLMASCPFMIYSAAINGDMWGKNHFKYLLYVIVGFINGLIGWVAGKELEKKIINLFNRSADAPKKTGTLFTLGIIYGLIEGIVCGLLIGFLTGTAIFIIIGTIIGLVIGPILGLIFGAIMGGIYVPIIEKELSIKE
jgi:hypothetical protein